MKKKPKIVYPKKQKPAFTENPTVLFIFSMLAVMGMLGILGAIAIDNVGKAGIKKEYHIPDVGKKVSETQPVYLYRKVEMTNREALSVLYEDAEMPTPRYERF